MTENSYTIYHNFRIEGKAEEVFGAIANPEHLINWWPLKCTGKMQVGGAYNLNFTDTYDWYGVVDVYEPGKAFHVSMVKSDDDWHGTTFGFDLEEQAGSVKVQFFHKNWKSVNEHFKIASFCWAMLLNGLKMYVEHGTIIPFEKRN